MGWKAVPLHSTWGSWWIGRVWLHGSQQCTLAAEQANSILDNIYRSRGSIWLLIFCCLILILISCNVFVFVNNEPIVCCHFCYCPFYRFSLLHLWAVFLSFWGQTYIYVKCAASSQHVDWKLGILLMKLLPSHINNSYYSKCLYLKWREKDVFTWC